jgi:fatty acid-binding protein DegV
MVLWTGGGELEVVDTVFSTEEAVRAMASRALRDQIEIRVASSLAGPEMAPMSEGLDALLAADPLVKDFVHYRVGPSVAAQTGPGTAGIFYYPA